MAYVYGISEERRNQSFISAKLEWNTTSRFHVVSSKATSLFFFFFPHLRRVRRMYSTLYLPWEQTFQILILPRVLVLKKTRLRGNTVLFFFTNPTQYAVISLLFLPWKNPMLTNLKSSL